MLQNLVNHIGMLSGIRIELVDDWDLWANARYCTNNPHYDSTERIRIYLRNIETDHTLISEYLLFHELGHATGSSKRLKRSIVIRCENVRPGDADRDVFECHKEEIIAEKIAIKLLEYFELMTPVLKKRTAAYIEKYAANINSLDGLDFEAERGFNYILNNWLVGFEAQKQSAA